MFQKIALSIGNDAYDRNRLGACVNDATDVGLSLKSIGFQVLLKTNMDARTTNMITNRFIQAIQPGSIALLYFSGHGLQFKGNNYLVATDNNDLGLDNLEEMAFNVQRVVDAMYRRRPRLILVILDCCRSYWHVEPPEKGRLSKIRSSRYKDGLAPMQAPPATIIAFACAADTVSSALSINDRNSLYTYHLLNHIRTPNVDIDTVLKNVAIDVRRDPVNMEHQVPFRYSSCNEFIYLSNNGAMDMSMPYGSYQPGFPYSKCFLRYSKHAHFQNTFRTVQKTTCKVFSELFSTSGEPIK
jgi:uncharacterized caspase-like protein